MKIGVMSDTHLREVTEKLIWIVEDLFKDSDMILHAGDVGSETVLVYLEARGVKAVRGNLDPVEVVRSLPAKRIIEAGAMKIGLMHGWGGHIGLAQKIRPEFDRIDCLVFGHSHYPANETMGKELYFNPGSATGTPRSSKNSVGFLHVTETIRGEIITID
jgi:putative phosphoesterase